MKNGMLHSVLEDYLKTYRGLIESESLDSDNIVLSFPFHIASNHRVEITVTRISDDSYILSDGARTIGELIESGYTVNKELRERLLKIAKISGMNISKDYLVLQTSKQRLSDDIQMFLEAAKTIGDVYLVHKIKQASEKHLVERVKRVLDEKNIVYKENGRLDGQIESHPFAFYAPANGASGFAIGVIGTQNTHNAAQVWGFKCDDIKRQQVNKKMVIGLIYDTENAKWSDESKRILESRADIALEGARVDAIPDEFRKHGVFKH